jgi:hypothetical protein
MPRHPFPLKITVDGTTSVVSNVFNATALIRKAVKDGAPFIEIDGIEMDAKDALATLDVKGAQLAEGISLDRVKRALAESDDTRCIQCDGNTDVQQVKTQDQGKTTFVPLCVGCQKEQPKKKSKS